MKNTHKFSIAGLITLAPLFMGVLWIEDRYNQGPIIEILKTDHGGEAEKIAQRIETYQHIATFYRVRIRDINYLEQSGSLSIYHSQQREEASQEADRLEGFIFGLRELQNRNN